MKNEGASFSLALKEGKRMGKIVHISEIKTPLTEAIKKWRADNV